MTSEGSRVGFFRSGATLADLKAAGTTPEVTELLMTEVMKGSRSGAMDWKIGDGRGSRGQVVGLEDVTSFRTSSGDRGENEDMHGMLGLVLDVQSSALGARGGKELLISSTFFSK